MKRPMNTQPDRCPGPITMDATLFGHVRYMLPYDREAGGFPSAAMLPNFCITLWHEQRLVAEGDVALAGVGDDIACLPSRQLVVCLMHLFGPELYYQALAEITMLARDERIASKTLPDVEPS